jgi:hypothetical protein
MARQPGDRVRQSGAATRCGDRVRQWRSDWTRRPGAAMAQRLGAATGRIGSARQPGTATGCGNRADDQNNDIWLAAASFGPGGTVKRSQSSWVRASPKPNCRAARANRRINKSA